MEIKDKKVAVIDYTVKTADGQLIESSEGHEPLAFLCGYQNVIPGLEKALIGKSAGEKLQIEIAPEDAYGERNEEMVKEVPAQAFQGVDNIEAGMQFHAESPNGDQLVTVTKVENGMVTVDGNHPLAGIVLVFDVDVKQVRDATEEELTRGHLHDESEQQN